MGDFEIVGGHYFSSSFCGIDNSDIIPNDGVELRIMVLKLRRINMRVDYVE